MSQSDDELDALIEEFLDYCDLQESGAMGVGLSFNTSIDHLVREERRKLVEEFVKFANQKRDE